MPQKRSAYKELRKAKKRHERNISLKSEIKTFIKKFESLVSDKKFDEAGKHLKALSSKLHNAASRGVMHKNAASRKISRLTKKLNRAIASSK